MKRRLAMLGLALFLLSLTACSKPPAASAPGAALKPCPFKTVALAPFQAAQPDTASTGVFCPISGQLYPGQRVDTNALIEVTGALPTAMDLTHSCAVVPPNRLAGYLPVEPGTPGEPVRRALAQAARKAGAEAILAGTVLRFRERKGSSIGVDQPASVALTIYLIDAKTAEILWHGAFDQTQRSLSEDLLGAASFFARGARWLTGAELAGVGLEDLLRRMPTQFD